MNLMRLPRIYVGLFVKEIVFGDKNNADLFRKPLVGEIIDVFPSKDEVAKELGELSVLVEFSHILSPNSKSPQKIYEEWELDVCNAEEVKKMGIIEEYDDERSDFVECEGDDEIYFIEKGDFKYDS